MKLSIRHKLALLAGVPIVGALLLALQIIDVARVEAHKAEALGSIESLAELSARTTNAVHALQLERASEALSLGLHQRISKPGADGQDFQALGLAVATVDRDTEQRERTTDRTLAALDGFLRARDMARLPQRLARPLIEARALLESLPELRSDVQTGKARIADVLELHRAVTRDFVRAVAGLTDLSDDGDLLRSINSLVSLLQLEERMSREHALLAYVFAFGEFPPGSYRELVSLVSEQDIYLSVFRTTASVDHQAKLDKALASDENKRLLELRRAGLESTEDDLTVSPNEWFSLGEQRLALLARIEASLNDEVRSAALGIFRSTQRALLLSLALVSGVVLFSVLFAWVLGVGITRRVEALRDASKRIAAGYLDVRVPVSAEDELGQLAAAFNDMTNKLARARAALSDQARMARELEIAAQIQRALLPPEPLHPEFEFAGRMLPADEVGGDFYDVSSDPSKEALWISIGDVSGHGVGAGLVMLMAQAAFASHFLSNPKAEPASVLRDVNALLCENIGNRLRDTKYVTAQLLSYAGAGRFLCVGAHEWPLVYRAGNQRCESIETPGPWLGIALTLDDVPVTVIVVEPGDVLCLYSDGVTEARNTAGEQFDVARLAAAIERQLSAGAALERVGEAVFAEVEAFSGRHDDDWTLLLVKRELS